ncbi:MAG: hypothetical protein KGR48_06850 [Alphaproteobacteria bacterium]|nr:hypothetical protein [Alphaproteobacteria bacterium]MBU6471291.1 hypothetical protein [Alphaproteobacteria bacterium]MDE2011424.1 hypothetical protein [Alphaproteobacteria bacterium]MDE2071815.1 hypothetical protein [Alphaproteobacteria bacterium]MDE2350916.1 hypothetical protein [Alphaproteobacteria bacterium]
MKISQLVIAVLLAGAAASPALALEAYHSPFAPQPQTVPTLALRAIEAATPELHKLKPDWQTYKVQAAETPDTLIISFWQQPAAPANVAAVPNAHAEFVIVELDKVTLKITAVRQFHV